MALTITRKVLDDWLAKWLPTLRFEKPKGLPRGATWAIKPDPSKNFIYRYDEGEWDPETGKFTVTIAVPFELEYTYVAHYERPEDELERLIRNRK